jgi:hypothetical protein
METRLCNLKLWNCMELEKQLIEKRRLHEQGMLEEQMHL